MTNAPDRLLAEWLAEGPDLGPRHGLERALAETRRTPQRPGWTFVQRWIPMELAMRRAFVPRPLILILVAALIALALAGVILSAGSPHRLPPAFGPAALSCPVESAAGVAIYACEQCQRPRTPRRVVTYYHQ